MHKAPAAGQQPNAATDAHFVALREHFSEQAMIEMKVFRSFLFLDFYIFLILLDILIIFFFNVSVIS